MTIPTMTFEISFDDVSDTTPAWTDVTLYAEAFSCTRGRNHELSRIDAGTATVTLDNADGRFTPGNAAGAYYPNVVPRRRLRITAVFSAVTYRLFTGYIESWKLTPSGDPEHFSTVTVTAVDAFKILSGKKLRSAYAERVMANAPAAYLPLTEPDTATSAGNRVTGSIATVPLSSSKNGSAGSVFGGTKVLNYGDPGTALNLNPASTATRAEILDCSDLPSAYPTFNTPWTFEAWLLMSQGPGGTQYILRHQSLHGTGINGFAISVHTDGTINVSTASEVDFLSTTFPINDAKPHHVVLRYDTNATNGIVGLYIDGVQIGTTYTLAASPFPFGEQAAPANTNCCIGGVLYATHVQDGGLRASLGHVAFYPQALSSAASNYLSNGTFEAGTTGWATGGNTPAPTLAQSSDRAHTSSNSLRITFGTTVAFSGAQAAVSGLIIGRTYMASGWVYVQSGPAVQIDIASGPTGQNSGAATWTQINCAFTATATAHTVQFLSVSATTAGQVAYVDDVLVTEADDNIGDHWRAGFSGSPEGETIRVGVILDFAGWPSADRNLEAAYSTLQPRDWAESTPALNVLTDAASDAGAVLFISGDGLVTMQTRGHRYNRAVGSTYGSGSEPEVDGFSVSSDDTEIRNTLAVSRAGQGVTQLVDAASVLKYGSIEYAVDLAVTSDDEVVSAAQWALYLYADPGPRVPSVTWSPATASAALFPKLLPLEIGDRITLTNLPATVPDAPIDVFVESITHGSGSSGQEWLTTCQLSPAGKYDVSVWDTGEWGTGGVPPLIWAY